MPMTEFALNHPLAVQRWSMSLAKEAAKNAYFRRFIGTGKNALIMELSDLKKAAGDKITYALRQKMTDPGIEGDNILEHTAGEEALNYFSDAIFVDQLRKGTKSKGKMSEQRVPYNMRLEGRDSLSVWWSEEMDEQIMIYLAGLRGIDTSLHNPLDWTGRANNALEAPDSDHLVYAGDATGHADLDSADKMDLALVEQLVTHSETQDPMVQPFNYQGGRKYVLLMHPFQAYDLRTATSNNDWLYIHSQTDGKDSPIYKNALGEYRGVVLHSHRNVVRMDDSIGTGLGGSVTAARALFLGAQSGTIAFAGGSSASRFSWHEEADDRGNALAIASGLIFGIKACVFNSKRFGMVAADTYAANPFA